MVGKTSARPVSLTWFYWQASSSLVGYPSRFRRLPAHFLNVRRTIHARYFAAARHWVGDAFSKRRKMRLKCCSSWSKPFILVTPESIPP